MPLERDDTNCDAQYFIGKVQIVREGDEFLVAEKTPCDWLMCGEGGPLYTATLTNSHYLSIW